ncbi:DUF5776 domain-containing protein [Apilactobacillus micheneri]|uniref:DUF5776 domain-containing protein n=1 Tax=Apilactobacillus micheneri TaxID=1899430 RepID=UPI0011270F5F|nr:DUF5776 domain-containing protein [Apilactobacillus micheneri]TPR50782.1 hypothetical protein DY126_06955 [Apilactobacillus micheneri]
MKKSKLVNNLLLSLAVIPLSLTAVSAFNQQSVNAKITVSYEKTTEEEAAKRANISVKELREDFAFNQKILHGSDKKNKTSNNSFYKNNDFKNSKHKITVLKTNAIHKNISLHDKSTKTLSKNAKLTVKNIVRYKNTYRFKLTNNQYITANKSYIKLSK